MLIVSTSGLALPINFTAPAMKLLNSHTRGISGITAYPVPIRHMGTEHCRQVLKSMRDYLESRLTITVETAVSDTVVENGQMTGIITESGEQINCRYLMLAPGREGADWLMRGKTDRLKMTTTINPIDIGVRVGVQCRDGRIEQCPL